jgi:hypothetical protein
MLMPLLSMAAGVALAAVSGPEPAADKFPKGVNDPLRFQS